MTTVSCTYENPEMGIKAIIPIPQAPEEENVVRIIERDFYEKKPVNMPPDFTIEQELVNFAVVVEVGGEPVEGLDPAMTILVCFTEEIQGARWKLGYWDGRAWQILWREVDWLKGQLEECPFENTPFIGAVSVEIGGGGWADPAMAWGS